MLKDTPVLTHNGTFNHLIDVRISRIYGYHCFVPYDKNVRDALHDCVSSEGCTVYELSNEICKWRTMYVACSDRPLRLLQVAAPVKCSAVYISEYVSVDKEQDTVKVHSHRIRWRVAAVGTAMQRNAYGNARGPCERIFTTFTTRANCRPCTLCLRIIQDT